MEENLKKVPNSKDVVKETTKVGEYNAEIIRDWYGNEDITRLPDKDPDFAYRFVRDDSKSGGKNIATKTSNLLFQKGGWQICPKEHCLRIGIEESKLDALGFYRQGDMLLAFMPKKLYEEKEKYKNIRANEPIKAINRIMEKGDASIGGKDIHPSMKGFQTAEKLGMK